MNMLCFLLFRIIFMAQICAFCCGTVHLEEHDFTYEVTAFCNGRRYRVSNQRLSYEEATSKCNKENATLAVVTSHEENYAIVHALENSSLMGATSVNQEFVDDGVWIGLRLNRGNNALGRWSDGTLYNCTSSYADWAPNEPRSNECVQLWKAFFWQWDDTYCDLKRHFVCEDQDPQSYSTQQIEELKESLLELSHHQNISKQDLNLLSQVANNILEANMTAEQNSNISGSDLLLAIEEITNKYDASKENYSVNRENIAIDIVDLNSTGEQLVFGEDTSDTYGYASSLIVISRDLLQETLQKSNKKDVQLNSVLFRQPSFFDENVGFETSNYGEGPLRQNRLALGHVISVSVKDTEMSNLKSSVMIHHLIPLPSSNLWGHNSTSNFNFTSANSLLTQSTGHPHVNRRISLKCAYWDFETNGHSGKWSDSGCKITALSSNNFFLNITCSCDHMTNFGILLDSSEYYEPDYSTVLTVIGCVVSIVCLTCTLITHLYFEQLRSKVHHQILINICISLILLNGTFTVGIDRTQQESFCRGTAILLHYALLLSWSWMLVKGIFLFRTLALNKISSGAGLCFIWVATISCYVVPGIVVGLQAGLLHDDYLSERYCWLSADVVVYSIVVPIGIVLFVNVVVFLVVLWSITVGSKRFRNSLDRHKLSQALKRAACMMMVLGLPWIFGYAMLLSKEDNIKYAFSVIFSVCNGIQGLGIFLLYCIRQENVRYLWNSRTQRFYRRTVLRIRAKGVRRQKFSSENMQQSCENNTTSKVKTSSNLSSIPTVPTLFPTHPLHLNKFQKISKLPSPIPRGVAHHPNY